MSRALVKVTGTINRYCEFCKKVRDCKVFQYNKKQRLYCKSCFDKFFIDKYKVKQFIKVRKKCRKKSR
jgi:hypothetical protein